MSYDGTGLSVADAIALRDDNGNRDNSGFGDGNGWWIMFLFFLLAWGGGGWQNGYGNGGAGMQGALTRADLCQDMNFSQLENGVRGISQGICDSTFALNNSINGVNTNMMQGFAGVDNAICNLGYTMQQGNFAIQQAINADTVANMQNTNALSAQLANCCCENRAGQADIKYQMATDTCAIQNTIQNTTRDIIDNNNCNTRQVLDFLVNTRLQDLQTENQNLKLAASQERQNTFLLDQLKPCPRPAYLTCNPYTGGYGGYGGYGNYGGYGYNNCGCNSGCGC